MAEANKRTNQKAPSPREFGRPRFAISSNVTRIHEERGLGGEEQTVFQLPPYTCVSGNKPRSSLPPQEFVASSTTARIACETLPRRRVRQAGGNCRHLSGYRLVLPVVPEPDASAAKSTATISLSLRTYAVRFA